MAWVVLAGFLAFQVSSYLQAPEPFIERVVHENSVGHQKAE